ncbi:unnamed protein product [Prunus armeniaca]
MSAKQISIHSDSQLIVNQITADFVAKDASMSAYLSAAHQLLQKQSRRCTLTFGFVEILSQASTAAAEVCTIRYKETWMSPIYAFLMTENMPIDKSQARKLRYRSAKYTVINDVL